MEEKLVEWKLTGEGVAYSDHTECPEKHYVVACFKDICGVEGWLLFERPGKDSDGQESRGEPGVEDVFVWSCRIWEKLYLFYLDLKKSSQRTVWNYDKSILI